MVTWKPNSQAMKAKHDMTGDISNLKLIQETERIEPNYG